MTGPEVTAAMKAEDVDAALVEKAAEAMNAHAPAPADDLDARFGLRNGCSCGQMNSREGRQAHVAAAVLAAVLPEIQAQALEEAATTVAREVGIVWPSQRHPDAAEAASYAAEVLRANARAARDGEPAPYAARLTTMTGEPTT